MSSGDKPCRDIDVTRPFILWDRSDGFSDMAFKNLTSIRVAFAMCKVSCNFLLNPAGRSGGGCNDKAAILCSLAARSSISFVNCSYCFSMPSDASSVDVWPCLNKWYCACRESHQATFCGQLGI